MGKLRLVNLVMVLALLLALVPGVVSAAPPAQEGESYVVQKDDYLSLLADKYLGNAMAYVAIMEATNAKSAEDPTFAFINNPNLIEPGWKLWIPSADEAATMMEELIPVSGGTLVVGLSTESLIGFDPADHRSRFTETVLRNMFDGLVTRTTTNKVVPEIADSWEWV
ncbi:MAG: LysM peptidoglycan-binding domain-containing protein, partial [Anaerolineae bacterium]|nr:LysM peptidoglycan-binding domain-containing protein [Anaerolineae bacterium]